MLFVRLAAILEPKRFDLVLLPEKGHRLPTVSPYWREAIRRFFQEHLKPEKVVDVSEGQTPLK
ncbi:MAG: hypothetical protein IH969_08070 [Candidatus Krumholzibacteriota bacterium]|nr:hypothetical protein [Candidatus Krumholzibacteriota bacterium]